MIYKIANKYLSLRYGITLVPIRMDDLKKIQCNVAGTALYVKMTYILMSVSYTHLRIIYVTDAKKQLDATIEDIEKNLKKNGLKLKKHDILRVYSQEEQWERAFTDPDICMRMEASKLFQDERTFANLKRLYSYTDITDGVAEEIGKNRLRLMENCLLYTSHLQTRQPVL